MSSSRRTGSLGARSASRPSRVGEPPLRGEDRAQAGRVEELRRREIEHEIGDVVVEEARDLFFETRSRIGVELARDR